MNGIVRTSRPLSSQVARMLLRCRVEVPVMFTAKELGKSGWESRVNNILGAVVKHVRRVSIIKREIDVYLPPASSNRTLILGSSDKRAARAQPAVPAPNVSGAE